MGWESGLGVGGGEGHDSGHHRSSLNELKTQPPPPGPPPPKFCNNRPTMPGKVQRTYPRDMGSPSQAATKRVDGSEATRVVLESVVALRVLLCTMSQRLAILTGWSFPPKKNVPAPKRINQKAARAKHGLT